MLPEIKGTLLPILPWGEFSFDEVLAYHNGPRLLLQRSPGGSCTWLGGTTRTTIGSGGFACR